MKKYDDYTCRLYIEGDWSLDEMIDMIKDHTGGEKSLKTVIAGNFEIDVEDSQDADPNKLNNEDDFLFYKFSCYIEPVLKNDPKTYIKSLSKLILNLRSDGALVVASCEFEKEISLLTGWNWSVQKPNHP